MPGKDAFLASPSPQPPAEGEGESASGGRETRPIARRVFVDGVEVDPETMKPFAMEE